MKVLLIDDDAESARLLTGVLEADPGLVVVRIGSDTILFEAVAAHSPDVVIVHMAGPDRNALEALRQLAARDPRPVALFVREDDPGVMDEAISAGVSSYNVVGPLPLDVKPILRTAVALFHRHRQLREELDHAEKKLAERNVIDRAKAILIRERRLTEPAAYAWLRRQAMVRGRRIVEIAEDLVGARQRNTS